MSELAIRGFGQMEIGGAVRPFHLGTYQSRCFCELRGIELAEYLEVVSALNGTRGLVDSVLLCDVLYSALAAGAKLTKQPLDFTADDVTFWADDAKNEEIKKLFEVAKALRDEGEEPGKAKGPQRSK